MNHNVVINIRKYLLFMQEMREEDLIRKRIKERQEEFKPIFLKRKMLERDRYKQKALEQINNALLNDI